MNLLADFASYLRAALVKMILFIGIAVVLACLTSANGFARPAHKKNTRINVLFIAIDDLKPTIGIYGDRLALTPNIDKLALSGTVFRNSHCQQAVCAPSRASLLTGLRPDKTQVWDLKTMMRDKNPDIVTLPQYYIEKGYETAGTGKIFDPRSVDSKLDEPSWSVPYANVNGSRWIAATEKISTEAGNVDDSELMDGQIALKGIELMRQLSAGDKPFFLAVGFKKPHLPFVAPQKYWDLHHRDDFSIHPFQEHARNAPEFAFQPGWELRNAYVDIPKEGPISEQKQKELIHGYYACVSFIDEQVGKLMNELDALGLRENTVVILWGDHGWHLGDHDMWAKHTNFEQSTRSPLIISAPNISGGKSSDSPVEFVDIFPTLCQLTGVEIPSDLDGLSLVPVMDDPKFSVKPFAISQFHRTFSGQKVEGYALRTKRYRYVEWIAAYKSYDPYSDEKIVARELYDYETDPLETVSLVDSAEYKSVVEKLHGQLKNFLEDKASPVEDSQGSLNSSESFDLAQNYPIRFNLETKIKYASPVRGAIERRVCKPLISDQ